MATLWAMLNQEQYIGSTGHYIVDEGIDTGPIVACSSLPCDHTASYLQNVHSLYVHGAHMMVSAVNAFAQENTPPATPQAGEPCYYTAPTSKVIARFTELSNTLFYRTEFTTLCNSLGAQEI